MPPCMSTEASPKRCTATAWAAALLALTAPAVVLAQTQTGVRIRVSADVEPVAGVRVAAILASVGPGAVRTGTVEIVANGPYVLEARRNQPGPDSVSLRLPGGSWIALDSAEWRQLAAFAPGIRGISLEYRVTWAVGRSPIDSSPAAFRAVVRNDASGAAGPSVGRESALAPPR
jgi:hypothetical protein